MPPYCAPWAASAQIQAVQPSMFLERETSKSRRSALLNYLSSLYLLWFRNPVRAAYIASLESQISSLRDELATVYKTQGQNAQRLLAMTETLREKEELSRIESENLRKVQDDAVVLGRKVEQHDELMSEKDRTAQVIVMVSIKFHVPNKFCVFRSCMMKSIPCSSNSAKSKSAMRYLSKTMPNCCSAG